MKIIDLLPIHRNYDITPLYLKEYAIEFEINNIIYEGQYKTYPRDNVIYKLIHEYNLQVHPDNVEPNNIIAQILKSNIKIIPSLQKTLQLYGWFISSVETDLDQEFKGTDIQSFINSNFNRANIIIEPLHSDEVKTPTLLYHATPILIWKNKIQRTGLSPKTKSIRSTHPERVYFTTTPELAIELAHQIGMDKREYRTNKFDANTFYKTWAILQIDTTKIPKTKYISYFKVHKDLNTDEQFPHIPLYSDNYVPPTVIKLIKTINIY